MLKSNKPVTLLARIVLPLLIAVTLQTGLVISVLSLNGVSAHIRQNALDMLNERSQNKQQYLSVEMNDNWSYLMGTEVRVLETVNDILTQEQKTFMDIHTDAQLNERLLNALIPELITRIRSNNTTGVFLILDGVGMSGQPGSYAGIYLRDHDPTLDAADHSDLSILRGPETLARSLDMTRGNIWQQDFIMDNDKHSLSSQYFYQPLEDAQRNTFTETLHDGYWSPAFWLDSRDESQIITYSEALVNHQGEVYGVVGVEINTDYLASILGSGQFAQSGRGFYFLGMTEDGGQTYRRMVVGGEKYDRYFAADEPLLTGIEQQEDGLISVRGTQLADRIYGAVYPLTLYPEGSAFSVEQWVLIGMQDGETLFAFYNLVMRLFLAAAVMAIAVGLAFAILTGRNVIKPITQLSDTLQNSDPNVMLTLKKTNVLEIDCLSDAIMTLNREVIESATKVSKVLQMAGLSVGVFEIRDDSDTAYCSGGVFSLLNREDLHTGNHMIPKATCLQMVESAMQNPVDDQVYLVRTEQGERFLRIKNTKEQHTLVGTILDVTAEIESRRQIEKERDHDLLTGILNRRAFESEAEVLFRQSEDVLGIAALVMLDLDNLKYLNDTYGHDCGDGYIRAFADSLRMFGTENTLIARRSGDEFYVLLYGAHDKQQLRERIELTWKSILRHSFTLPEGTQYRMRVSAGIAWYPSDSRDLNQLILYADFAMYKVKHSSKGTLEEFDIKDYNENSFLISGRNALDRLIDYQLIRFALQPIISSHTGNIYGYELLMRSTVSELPDPLTVLRLARAEGKLQHIERLTWMKGLEAFNTLVRNRSIPTDCYIFLNSIANQLLKEEDERLVEEEYASLLPRLVVEVTESEKSDQASTRHKIDFVRSHGGMIAIDDFGTGYSTELSLMQIAADIVKLDISLVRNVDVDQDKQALVRNIISYAKQRGMAVLAEGVETREEMSALIRFGVDYLQGFYLGRPQFQPMNTDKLLRREIRRISGELPDEDDGFE